MIKDMATTDPTLLNDAQVIVAYQAYCPDIVAQADGDALQSILAVEGASEVFEDVLSDIQVLDADRKSYFESIQRRFAEFFVCDVEDDLSDVAVCECPDPVFETSPVMQISSVVSTPSTTRSLTSSEVIRLCAVAVSLSEAMGISPQVTIYVAAASETTNYLAVQNSILYYFGENGFADFLREAHSVLANPTDFTTVDLTEVNCGD